MFVFPGSSVETACGGSDVNIACMNGQTVSVISAFFGRLDQTTCPHQAMSDTNCQSPNSLAVVKEKCQGAPSCQVLAAASTFGGDPCFGTFKYLEVSYSCVHAGMCIYYKRKPDCHIGHPLYI